jgi:riboflavin kinase, archaea type
MAACGGWSKRKTLFGADRGPDREPDLLDPARDAAKVRAIFVHPHFARRGLGSLILAHVETAAQAAGFHHFEMGSTLTGVPLYRLKGYIEVERIAVPLPNGETLPVVKMVKTAATDERNVKMSILRGKVVSGMGNFSYWIAKLHEHYQRKTGMSLFPGTLNVQLDQPYTLPRHVIRLEGHEYGGSVSVSIAPCSILGKSGFILRTDANEEGRGHHPKTIVEIATDVKLRDHFHLNDGDTVEIETFDRTPNDGN